MAAGADNRVDLALQCLVIRSNRVIVSTSFCRLKNCLAGIHSVLTVPEQRRKGLGEHVTAEPPWLASGSARSPADLSIPQDLDRDVRPVRDQPVDPQVEHALHRFPLVDGPGKHLQPEALRLGDVAGIQFAPVR